MRASLDLNDPVATGQSVPADITNRGQPSDLEDIVMQDFRDEEQELEPRGDNHDVSTWFFSSKKLILINFDDSRNTPLS